MICKFRGKGIGEKLLKTAKELVEEKKFKGLALETTKNNPAQKLDWRKDNDYFHYFWKNPN
ncbi:MAG: GNAT family N-acetyltransferase [Bacteroidota bacterium]